MTSAINETARQDKQKNELTKTNVTCDPNNIFFFLNNISQNCIR